MLNGFAVDLGGLRAWVAAELSGGSWFGVWRLGCVVDVVQNCGFRLVLMSSLWCSGSALCLAAVSKLAPLLLELIGLAVAEVAEDEMTSLIRWMSWMDGRDETADEPSSRSSSRVGHSAGDGRRWTEAIARPTTSERIRSAHGESGMSTSAGCGESLARMCTADQ